MGKKKLEEIKFLYSQQARNVTLYKRKTLIMNLKLTRENIQEKEDMAKLLSVKVF